MEQGTQYGTFVGLDMVDGTRPSPRRVDLAFLDESLLVKFGAWDFEPHGRGLYPSELAEEGFLLAIDGPQGLAMSPGDTMRVCERIAGAPGHASYDFPAPSMPFSGFVTSSVRLFAALWRSGTFHLHGAPVSSNHMASLIEVYPGRAWPDLATIAGIGLTENKQRREGRRQRQRVLKAMGLRLPPGQLPTHDQLDAAVAAFTGYLFARGKAREEGEPPFWDAPNEVLREGFIVYPGL